MDLVMREETAFTATPEELWRQLSDIQSLPSFVGYGPIPGIASARWLMGNGTPGSIREVLNTDGSRHREEIVVLDPYRQIEDRIYDLTSPFRLLVREARDTFELIPDGEGTRLARTVRFTLTSPVWWPAARVAVTLFRRAVRRHHSALAERLPT